MPLGDVLEYSIFFVYSGSDIDFHVSRFGEDNSSSETRVMKSELDKEAFMFAKWCSKSGSEAYAT